MWINPVKVFLFQVLGKDQRRREGGNAFKNLFLDIKSLIFKIFKKQFIYSNYPIPSTFPY